MFSLFQCGEIFSYAPEEKGKPEVQIFFFLLCFFVYFFLFQASLGNKVYNQCTKQKAVNLCKGLYTACSLCSCLPFILVKKVN